MTATTSCGECAGGGTWVENVYKKLDELALLPNQQRATSGDCDDDNENVNPGKMEVPGNGIDDDCNAATSDTQYEIVFELLVDGAPASYDTWLPTHGAQITATARVRDNQSGGALIPFQTVSITVADVSAIPGKYTNDSVANGDPDYENVTINGDTINLTSKDFGGTVTFYVTGSFSGGSFNNQVVRLPKDADLDGIADSWEATYCGGNCDPATPDSENDGKTTFDEYRGYMWGKLDRIDPASAPQGTWYYGLYKTIAFIPQGLQGEGTITHIRTDPRRRDLFVKYSNFDLGAHHFAIGEAYDKEGIDVHAVDVDLAANFDNLGTGTGLGETSIKVLRINNEVSATFNSESPHIYQQGIRSWNIKVFGQSGIGDGLTYGSSTIYQRPIDCYADEEGLMDRPYKDGTTLDPSSTSLRNGPWIPPDGELNPIARVEDANDNGKKDGGEDKNGNASLDGDNPVPLNSGQAGPPWRWDQNFSPFDIDGNKKVENPVATTTVNTTYEYTKAQIYKHVITHEMEHGVGIRYENEDPLCVMYRLSNNWSRDNHFNPDAAALIRIP